MVRPVKYFLLYLVIISPQIVSLYGQGSEAPTAGNYTQSLEEALCSYYQLRLEGRVQKWSLQIRQVAPSARQLRDLSVHGDEGPGVPRGARLCWVSGERQGQTYRYPVSVFITTWEKVPVAIRDIPPRTDITSDLFEYQERETTHLGALTICPPEVLHKGWAKTAIPKGEILTDQRVIPKPRITVGEEVQVIYRKGGLEVRLRGKALQDGNLGETVKVLNPSSKVRVEGVVSDWGEVSVQ